MNFSYALIGISYNIFYYYTNFSLPKPIVVIIRTSTAEINTFLMMQQIHIFRKSVGTIGIMQYTVDTEIYYNILYYKWYTIIHVYTGRVRFGINAAVCVISNTIDHRTINRGGLLYFTYTL